MPDDPHSTAVVGREALAAFELSRTGAFDEVCAGLSELFAYPGTIVPTTPESEEIPSLLRAVELTHMTLGVIRFGTETRIATGPLRSYHVTVPIRGEVACRFGGQDVVVAPGTAAVAGPDLTSLVPRWPASAEALCIKIRRDAVEDELASMIGRPVHSPVRLQVAFDLEAHAARSWLSALELLLRELSESQSLSRASRTYREEVERLLIGALLRAQRHDFSTDVWTRSAPARWRTVTHVVDAIQEMPERPWTLDQLAELAGVSARRLQQGFRAQVGMSPTAYLQNVRLERVHRDLLRDAGAVTDLSMRWGFTHPGRFAGSYRARYGESPSETRRRVRVATVGAPT